MRDITPKVYLARLQDLESRIEEELQVIEEATNSLKVALAEIHDDALWRFMRDGSDRPLYESWEHYCQVRWHRHRNTINDRVIAGRVVREMEAAGVPPAKIPVVTSQLIELKPVPVAERVEVLQVAQQITGGAPTAESIRAAKEIVVPETGKTYRINKPGHQLHGRETTVQKTVGRDVAIVDGGFTMLPRYLEPVEPKPEPELRAAKPKPRDREREYRLLLLRVLRLEGIPDELRADIEAALA